jgi:ribosome-associated protein
MGLAAAKAPQNCGPWYRRQRHAKFTPQPEEEPLSPAKKKKAVKKPAAKKPAAKKSTGKTVASKKPAAKKAKPPAKKPAPAKSKAKAKKPAAAKPALRKAAPETELLKRIRISLEDDKAEEIVTIDLAGRSSLCDAVVIASGRSSRHVMSIAEHLARRLKEEGYGSRPVNGAAQGDWALVDAGDVIVHIFRPEVREYYDLEGMWSVQ